MPRSASSSISNFSEMLFLSFDDKVNSFSRLSESCAILILFSPSLNVASRMYVSCEPSRFSTRASISTEVEGSQFHSFELSSSMSSIEINLRSDFPAVPSSQNVKAEACVTNNRATNNIILFFMRD